MGDFAPSFLLLQHEGYLFRTALLTGLNAARHANISDPGKAYTAFFQLSIGAERVLKTIVIIDHMSKHDVPPSNKQLRAFGHDIGSLIRRVAEVPLREGSNPLIALLEPSAVEAEIIGLLDEFAKNTRYYNLDALSRGRADADPLPRWNALLQRLVRENVPSQRVMSIMDDSAALAALFEPHARVLAHDFDGQRMDLTAAFTLPRLHDKGCTYAVWHIVKILAALRECLWEVTWREHERERDIPEARVPYMYEFLNFTYGERREVLRKKRWP
jgi:hypothetical protein